ncbi:MAG: hypothetical protein ACLFQQ_13845 [Desulfococcaceae bacterium]
MSFNFEWDTPKWLGNYPKHGALFDEAATVFRDSNRISIFDPDCGEIEERRMGAVLSKAGFARNPNSS